MELLQDGLIRELNMHHLEQKTENNKVEGTDDVDTVQGKIKRILLAENKPVGSKRVNFTRHQTNHSDLLMNSGNWARKRRQFI